MPLSSAADAEEKPFCTFSLRIHWKTARKALRNLSGKSTGKGNIPFLVVVMIVFLVCTGWSLVRPDITVSLLSVANLIWVDCILVGGVVWLLSEPCRWGRKWEASGTEMDWWFYREHCVAGSEWGQTVYPYRALSSLKKVQNGYAVMFSGERKWVGLIFPNLDQEQGLTDWWQFMNRKLAENAERRMETSQEKLRQIQAQNAQEACQAEILQEFQIQGLLTGKYVWEACRALNPVSRQVRSKLRCTAVMAIVMAFVAGRSVDPTWEDFAFVLLGIGILLAAFCLWMSFPLGEIRRRMVGHHLFRKDLRAWHFRQEECVEMVGGRGAPHFLPFFCPVDYHGASLYFTGTSRQRGGGSHSQTGNPFRRTKVFSPVYIWKMSACSAVSCFLKEITRRRAKTISVSTHVRIFQKSQKILAISGRYGIMKDVDGDIAQLG